MWDDYSQLGATRLVGYLPSHIQCALVEQWLIIIFCPNWRHRKPNTLGIGALEAQHYNKSTFNFCVRTKEQNKFERTNLPFSLFLRRKLQICPLSLVSVLFFWHNLKEAFSYWSFYKYFPPCLKVWSLQCSSWAIVKGFHLAFFLATLSFSLHSLWRFCSFHCFSCHFRSTNVAV